MSNQQLIITPSRLPYHAQIEEKLGVTKGQWNVLCDAVFPNVTDPNSILLALNYCKSRNLDIFKRPIHIVPIYSSSLKRMVDTVWQGISELRTTASRTKNYAGMDRAEFGPDITETLGNVPVTYPEWCAITVYRMVDGHRCPFVGPAVYWKETYATSDRKTTAPNAMWAKRPRSQLEKCAEAAALRRAFPEEIGNEYAAEEMEGQGWRDTPPVKIVAPDPFADDEAETEIEEGQSDDEPAQTKPQQWPVPDDLEGMDEKIKAAALACEDRAQLVTLWEATVDLRDAIRTKDEDEDAAITDTFNATREKLK